MMRILNSRGSKIVLIAGLFFTSFTIKNPIIAKEENEQVIDGFVYEIQNDKNFKYSDSDKNEKSTNQNTIGSFHLAGKVAKDPNKENSYICEEENILFQYRIDPDQLEKNEDTWHLTSSNAKTVNEVDLNAKVESGALIIQTSRDGENWVTDLVKTDIFKGEKELKDPFYTTQSIQLDNGCYYKATVAYTLEKKTGTKKILFLDTDEKQSKQIVESYMFYLQDGEDDKVTIETSPKKEFSTVVNTGKDNGYSEKNSIGNKDPHFGWNIGHFTINGYTRETNYDGTPIYLKNYGDKVTLWFTLNQDINQLNGKENLSISEDVNGYDNEFKVQKTNFGHGTLLIRYTDENGNIHDPIIYTDFLAANATTTADTKVQLFEEGDYEVALDYEIEEKSGIGSIKKTYNNYKTLFSFKIRNGNNMVFPFDVKSGNELSNNDLTEDGFRLDLAQSKYLTIDVTRSNIKMNKDHLLTEDIRYNRPAKDGDEFTEEGVYTITVKNLYTDGKPTVKTIYIGDNPYFKALSKYNLTIDELNEQIRNGASVNDDGTLSNTSLKATR